MDYPHNLPIIPQSANKGMRCRIYWLWISVLSIQFLARGEGLSGDPHNECDHKKSPLRVVGLLDGITVYNLSYGRLEGRKGDRVWRPICAADENSFSAEDVDVACYQLGFVGRPETNMTAWEVCSESVRADCLELKSNDYWKGDINCTGTELFLYNCPCKKSECSSAHKNDVVITCSETLQVALKYTTNYDERGVLNHYYNQTWTEVCLQNHNTINNTGKVVCRQLGLGVPDYRSITVQPADINSESQYLVTDAQCTGDEEALRLCKHTTWQISETCNGNLLRVKCQGPFISNLHGELTEYTAVKLTWDIPMPLVYYPAVSRYVVSYTSSNSGNKSQILLTSASKEGRVTGQVIDLTYGEEYTFRVAAQLSHGTGLGPFSDPVTVTTSHNPYLYSYGVAAIFLGITTGVLCLISMALCHCACKCFCCCEREDGKIRFQCQAPFQLRSSETRFERCQPHFKCCCKKSEYSSLKSQVAA